MLTLLNKEERDAEVIVIKRYSNRKLYNTRSSQYVTILELLDMVNGGISFIVLDNLTKRDITGLTLTQALSETVRLRIDSDGLDGDKDDVVEKIKDLIKTVSKAA